MKLRLCLTALFLVGLVSPVLAMSTVSLPVGVKTATGLDVVVPITVSPADGVTAIDLTFDYNPSVLTATGVYGTSFVNGFTIVPDLSTPGTVSLTMSGATPLSGSGEVAWVLFHVTGATGASTPLTWVSALLNTGTVADQTVNGSFSVISAPVTIGSPDGQGTPGSQVQIPISATAFTGGDSFDLVIRFNPNVLSALSVAKTSLTASLTLASNVSAPGEVRAALFGTSAVSGSGPLVNITYNVVGAAGSSTALDVTRGDINERVIPTVLDDGIYTVCAGTDADHDGFTGCQGDCNDQDPTVHPGAPDTMCDGIDHNCNGVANDGYVPVATQCGVGACASTGTTSCVNGHVQNSCVAGTPAANDATCNGIDDDCDGSVDEEFVPAATSCGVGACFRTGVTSCVAGTIHDSCVPGTPAVNDATCNGIDDNCNGSADEGYVPTVTSCGVGACFRTGVTSCVAGTVQNSCIAGTPAANDATCNGIDDNCNGLIDEDYVPTATNCGVGACARTGATYCAGGAVHNSCVAGLPVPEICDGVDNNCDGTVDNAQAPAGVSSLSVLKTPTAVELSWTPVAGATAYDVVRGTLSVLIASGGNFATATASCLANDLPSPPAVDTDPRAAFGDGFWYLQRAVNCGGAGTYDTGDPAQAGSRDPGIALSSGACP